MSLNGAYDRDNVFAKILRGQIPAAKVFEDEATFSFMDAFPQSRGHALVIHRTATARNLLDVEPPALAAIMNSVRKLARATLTALNPDGLMVTQFNGSAAGQTVFHLHFHLIPRWEGVPLGKHADGGMADPAELKALASQIAACLEP